MQTQIIDGKKIRDEILKKVKDEVATLSFQPIFCDVLVGDNPTSEQYVRMKAKYAESVGIKFHNVRFVESISQSELVEEIKNLNRLENICGLIIQLPLPRKFNEQEILNAVSPTIDVDCLNEETSELFYRGEGDIAFPTALACMNILDTLNVDIDSPSTMLRARKIVVVGQGILVGRPVTYMLKKKGFEVNVISRNTEEEERKDFLKNADVIISAVGQEKIIKGDMVKDGAIVIDAGTSESGGGIVGDVDMDTMEGVASFVSRVPGGVGPVTVAMLLNNVLQVAKNKSSTGPT